MERFIPARAGNSSIEAAHSRNSTVHPRACGELLCQVRGLGELLGSSPRVRGTPLAPRVPSGTVRFIPARAGNSFDERRDPVLAAVHPRACGELG